MECFIPYQISRFHSDEEEEESLPDDTIALLNRVDVVKNSGPYRKLMTFDWDDGRPSINVKNMQPYGLFEKRCADAQWCVDKREDG